MQLAQRFECEGLHRPERVLGGAVAKAPSFSRSGFTGLFGKLSDEPVNGLKLPIEVVERARLRANEAGLPFHEYLREIVSLGVMGREEAERRFRGRLDAIAGTVKETK